MATNFATASYQEIIDLHTEADKVSVLGIHTPTGAKPRQMLAGFFAQFRKYKYNGCSLVMVPAARLPADPLGVSYEAGEPGSDPRDLLNPVLFHGCHGDNLNAALNSIYKGSFDYNSSSVGMDVNDSSVTPADSIDWESHYYRALSDPSFTKSNIMSPFRKKGLHPLVYDVASNMQIMPIEGASAIGELVNTGNPYLGISGNTAASIVNGTGAAVPPKLMTNRLTSLGWLDTKQVINSGVDGVNPGTTALPCLFMALLMLPPCYKTEMYMRLVLTHSFSFKQFNTSLSNAGAVDYNDWNADLSTSKDVKGSDSLELVNSSAEVITDGVF